MARRGCIEARDAARCAVAVDGGDLVATPQRRVQEIDSQPVRGRGEGRQPDRRRGRTDVVGPARHAVLHLGTRLLLFGRQPDPEVDAERSGDLLAPERAEAATVDATYDLTEQVPVGSHVFAVGSARLPPRLAAGEHVNQVVPVGPCLGRARLGERHGAGLMGQQMPDSGLLLAAHRILRPHRADQLVEREAALVNEAEHGQRRRPFRHRERRGDRVALPRHRARGISPTAPEVDDRFAVEHERNGATALVAVGEQPGEAIAHRREPRRRNSPRAERSARPSSA